MAYDEATYRRQTDDKGDDPAAYRANGHRRRGLSRPPAGPRSGRRRIGDGDIATEPQRRLAGRAGRRSGRDRVGVHIGWEIVLLLAVAAIGYLLYRLDPASLRRPALDTLLITGTAIGLLALGAGLTLRAGVPNLALGPIALAGSLHYAENGYRGLLDSAVPALVIAAGAGLVVALLVIGLHVPGWLATLAAGHGRHRLRPAAHRPGRGAAATTTRPTWRSSCSAGSRWWPWSAPRWAR